MEHIRFSQIAAMNEHFVLQTFESFLECVVQCGINNIELWAGLPHLYAPDMTQDKISTIKKQISSRNLSLICYTPEQCVYPYNIAAKEAEIREYSLDYFFKNLEIASELEAPMLQIVPGWGYRNEPREEALKRSMDSIERICKRSVNLGIRIVLEALEENESNLIRNAIELRDVLNTINLPNLGAVIDTCPMAAAGEDFIISHQYLNDRIWHSHFIDSEHLVWGDGDLPLRKYLRQLDQLEYKGFLTIEVLNDKYLLCPEKALVKSAEAITKYLA